MAHGEAAGSTEARHVDTEGNEMVGEESVRLWEEGRKEKRAAEREESDGSVSELESDEGLEQHAQGSEAPCTPTREKAVAEEELSEVGSVRSWQSAQHERTYDGDEPDEDAQRGEAAHASAEMEETNNDDAPGDHAATAQEEVQPPTENGYGRKFHRREREQQP